MIVTAEPHDASPPVWNVRAFASMKNAPADDGMVSVAICVGDVVAVAAVKHAASFQRDTPRLMFGFSPLSDATPMLIVVVIAMLLRRC
jgi:hypothetical protein